MGKKITVLGSFVVDLMGRSDHIPRPGETVKGSLFKMGAGGKGSNQAVAAKKAGADVVMISKVGDDEFANIALNSFRNVGIDTKYIYKDTDGNSTGAALIMVDEHTGQNSISVLIGACENMKQEEINAAADDIRSSEYLLMQLELNLDAIMYGAKLAYDSGVKVVLNPAPAVPLPDEIYHMLYCFMPNEVEAELLSGIKTDTNEGIIAAAEHFHKKGVKNVVITLGSRGSYVSTPEVKKFIPIIKVKAVDTTGAGDAFCGGFMTAIAEGKDMIYAANFGAITAGLKVTKMGTAVAMPTRAEIDAYISEHGI